MNLTQTLREQHAAIAELAKSIEDAVNRGDPNQVRTELKRFETVLSAHLALEDAELYPGLERVARENKSEHLALVATQFSSNMTRITDAFLGFLRKYDKPIVDLAGFKRDWSSIFSALSARTISEERTLYPLLEKALKAAKAG